MSYGTEQNLDEFLKSLRATTEYNTANGEEVSKENIGHVSDEDLQNRLKSLYQTTDTDVTEEQRENAYSLDESFLEEAVALVNDEGAVPSVSEELSEESPDGMTLNVAEEEDLPPWDEAVDFAIDAHDNSETEITLEQHEQELFEAEKAEEATVTEEEESAFEVEPSVAEGPMEDLPVEGLVGEITDDDLSGEDFSLEELMADISTEKETNQEASEFESSLLEEVRSMRSMAWQSAEEKANAVPFPPSVNDADSLDMDREALEEDFAPEKLLDDNIAQEEFDVSTVDLMLQLGCRDELEQSIGETKVQDMLAEQYEDDIPLDMRSYVRDGDEEPSVKVDKERLEAIKEGYHHRRSQLLFRLVGASVLTVILTLFEILPLLGVQYNGILDYNEYPKAYLLLGFQLLAFVCAFSWRPLWDSLKKTFLLRPDRYSGALLAGIAILLYDVAMACSDLTEPPKVFHLAGACVLLVTQIAEYMALNREMRGVTIFFSEEKKYTLTDLDGEHSLVEQMASDGNRNLHVYAPTSFKNPRSYFRAVSDRDDHKVYYFSFVAFVIAAILCIVSIALGAEGAVAFRIALISFLAMIPLSQIFMMSFVPFVASCRLAKRECALGGEESIERFAHTEVLLLRDLHLFDGCHAKNAGIVFYREEQTADAIAALHALYSAIGGPMESVFEELSPLMRAESIRIHRIARNGIEALVDDRHVLLVGEADFMKRYGLSFPRETASHPENATLCVSLDREVTAKISIRYTVLPSFDMLADRMAKEGIRCVIETYDPLINSAMIARLRKNKEAAVSVLHKNASDFNRREMRHSADGEMTEIVACHSRLKLVESVIWCCRIRKIKRWNRVTNTLFFGVALFFAVLFTALLTADGSGALFDWLNQLTLLFYQWLAILAGVWSTFLTAPSKDYFVTDAYLSERMQKPSAPSNLNQT